MIILDQDEGLLRLFYLVQYGLGEFPIHALILLPVFSTKHGTRMGEMAKWPDPLVREPQVVSLPLFLGKPEAAECVVRMFWWNSQPVIFVNGFPVCIRGAMGDPRAITGAQNRLQSRNQTARWHAHLDSVAAMYVFVRLAIGDHK